MDHPLTAKNVDGMINKKGIIEKYIDLEFKIDSRKFKEQFYITGLGKQKIILGFPWLQKHNPKIDWKTGKIKWKKYFLTFQQLFGKRKTNSKPMMEEQPDEEEWKNQTRNPINKDMNAIFIELFDEKMEINKINIATELAIEDNKKKTEKTDEELIPKEYHEYLDIFSEEKAAWFQNLNHGITKLKWKKDSNQNPLKITIWHQWNNSNWITFSKKIWKKDIFDHPNHLWHLHFSLYPRKMENFDCVKIIDILTMMDKIFVTMIEGILVIIYMDNILIFAKTKEELKQITKLVLERLREMIYSSRQRNVNLKRQKLNTLEWEKPFLVESQP